MSQPLTQPKKMTKNNHKQMLPFSQDEMVLQVLGCGSARPVPGRHPSGQVIRLKGKVYLIDCGEGTQVQLLRYKAPISELHRIFITHLHGDHCLGLPGLISSMSLVGLTHPVHIYGPIGTASFVKKVVRFFCPDESEENIITHELNPKGMEQVFEDGSLTVSSFPLVHRVPCIGYRFDEKPLLRHLDRAMADFHQLPVAYFGKVKQGEDYIAPDGRIIPFTWVTKESRPPYSFAYCSDTIYREETAEYAQNVDLIYHETTFGDDSAHQASKRGHSTAKEAALIAQKASAKALLMGHYSTRYHTIEDLKELQRQAQSVFEKSILGYDGLLLPFSTLR